MSTPAEHHRTTMPISITLNLQTKAVIDKMMTPPGFESTPKGSYSQLINTLLTAYIENHFEIDFLSVFDFVQANPECTMQELKEACDARKAAQH